MEKLGMYTGESVKSLYGPETQKLYDRLMELRKDVNRPTIVIYDREV